MENKEFDDIIKKKLESLNTNGSDNAWDLFKERWDSESSEDIIDEDESSEDRNLDAKIKQGMQGLRIPFNSKHWIILKEQLEIEALFKKKLFVAKSVELVILAFLVVGILNLWPIQKNIYQIPIYDIPMVVSIPVDQKTAEKHLSQEEGRLADQKSLNNQILTSTKAMVKKAMLSVDVLSSKQKENSIEKEVNKNSENEFRNLLRSPSIPYINVIKQASLNFEEVNPLNLDKSNRPMALLNSNNTNYLEIPIRPTGFPELVLINKTSNKRENTYLSFAFGPKVNLINSPFDPVYKDDPYNTINTNFNVSAKIQKEIGPVELYAGLGYTNTSYTPRLVDEVYELVERQYNVANLDEIKFKTFNIPIGVKYNILKFKKYQLYASAGVDLNVIADSKYIIQDQPVGGRFQPNLPPSTPKNTLNSKSKLSQKEFNKGILSGGNLKDNLYVAASVSLGLNWKTSSRTGLFVEPRYSHFISSNGIGPNADKVHSLSIELGVRYQLN